MLRKRRDELLNLLDVSTLERVLCCVLMEVGMFEIGEYVVYGNNGVCKVEDITKMGMSGVKSDRMYYKLIPSAKNARIIFTPVDNDKVVMRRVMSREEARKLIDDLPEIEPLEVKDDRQREEIYKKAFISCDPRQWCGIIRTLDLRKRERAKAGRKITSMDERYYRQVEEELLSELSVVLEMDKEKVDECIQKRLDEIVTREI